MKTLIILLFIFCTQSIFAQQRIGLDISAKSFGLNFNFNYQRVIYKNFLISAGISYGNYGRLYMNVHIAQQELGLLESPYPGRTNSVEDPSGTLNLYSYSSRNRAVGISIGIGAFKEFSVKHGIRFNLNAKFVYSEGNEKMGYGDAFYGVQTSHTSSKYIGSISPELVHTIRLSGRLTFFYGIKIPYYYSLDKGKYHPHYRKDIFNGFEPELTLGFTRVIGKCN